MLGVRFGHRNHMSHVARPRVFGVVNVVHEIGIVTSPQFEFDGFRTCFDDRFEKLTVL